MPSIGVRWMLISSPWRLRLRPTLPNRFRRSGAEEETETRRGMFVCQPVLLSNVESDDEPMVE